MVSDLILRIVILSPVVSVKGAYVTGYVVLAATAVSTVALTLIK